MKIENAVAASAGASCRPVDVRQPERRQPAGHRAEHGDAVGLEVDRLADDDRADHGDQRPGIDVLDVLRPQDDRGDDDARRRASTSSMSPMFWSVPHSFCSVRPVPSGTPSMPPTWPAATWIPTPVRKPTSTVRERKSARNPRWTSRAMIRYSADEQADEPGERDVLRRAGRGHAGEPGGEDRRRGGVGADDEVARGAEHGEHGERQQDRVEAGDHRHAGDLRVPHHLRDRERREGDPGEDVGGDPGAIERDDALEERDGELPWGRRLTSLASTRSAGILSGGAGQPRRERYRSGREQDDDADRGHPEREEQHRRS